MRQVLLGYTAARIRHMRDKHTPHTLHRHDNPPTSRRELDSVAE